MQRSGHSSSPLETLAAAVKTGLPVDLLGHLFHQSLILDEFVEYEAVGNLHMHTRYSDGEGVHVDIALAAIRAGLDFVIVTDHNVWVQGMDGYRYQEGKRVLLLTGEEIHDQAREPQKNHLLVYEARAELSSYAPDPQLLVQETNEHDGLSFVAHPIDPPAPLFGEDDLSWEAWDVRGLTGLEVWNFMSEFKSKLTSIPRAIYYAYNPGLLAQGPFAAVMERWDHMLAQGQRLVAIGGSDAHATPITMGVLKRIIFPYEFLFHCINTHVVIPEPLSGETARDRSAIFNAIRRGSAFIGYDLPAPTTGFRFRAQGEDREIGMGEEFRVRLGVTLQIRVPRPAQLRLLRSGLEIKRWQRTQTAVYTVREPGVYRVEAHIPFRGKLRTWILSNPIYLVA